MATIKQKADPAERQKAVRYVLLGLAIGLLFIAVYRALLSWAIADESETVERMAIVIGTLYLPIAPALLMCRHLWRLGTAVINAERFPPPGVNVTRDTPVVTGAQARRRGLVLRAVAVITVAAFLLTPVLLWWLLWSVTQ